LRAFINQIEALTQSGSLDQLFGDELIALAQGAIEMVVSLLTIIRPSSSLL
jgi:hypothetical protein